jgi:hypothetical protein
MTELGPQSPSQAEGEGKEIVHSQDPEQEEQEVTREKDVGVGLRWARGGCLIKGLEGKTSVDPESHPGGKTL